MNPINISRRRALQAAGMSAVAPTLGLSAAGKPWPLVEGPDTPKICLGMGPRTEAGMRRIRQIGVEHVIGGLGRIPWQESELRELMAQYKAAGISIYNLMIGGFNDAIYARPGRDEAIDKVIQSIRAAGRAGLPVVEYNWYAHRAMEGYYEETGRGGAGHTAFNYERMKDLAPLPEVGEWSAEQLWANLTYFLKAVIPVAVESGVRMALHPNDPPVAVSRGSHQIMSTLAGWKRLITLADSPANGITYDCGVTRELGEDPVEVLRYFGSRKRINHMHYRNVRVRKPYEHYVEVFLDEGQVDMFAVMKEVFAQKYTGAIYPEHPRALDYDRERGPIRGYPGGGGYAGEVYNVGYARAMMQAVMAS